MPKTNLSAYRTIRLYRLLHELQTETGEPLVLWLHRIACAVDPFIKHGQRLRLRPDESWKVSRVKEERIIVPVGSPHGGLARFAGMRDVTYWDPWEFNRSALIIFTKPPIDIHEPSGLESRLYDEGIQIHREDFHVWCETAGHPLPHFWFPELARKITTVEAEDLTPAQQREAKVFEDRKQAEEYAVQQRSNETTFKEIIHYLEESYGYKGQKLHDIIWPEHSDRPASSKRKELTKHRQKK